MRLIICIAIVWAQGCERIAMDRDHPFYLLNESGHSVKVYFNLDQNYSSVYPDTLISDFEDRLSVDILSGAKEAIAGGSASWADVFKVSAGSDTLSLFVFHSDTLAKYDWDVIRSEYKISKRYDLSLEDLGRLNYSVVYPPTLSMQAMKMYPK